MLDFSNLKICLWHKENRFICAICNGSGGYFHEVFPVISLESGVQSGLSKFSFFALGHFCKIKINGMAANRRVSRDKISWEIINGSYFFRRKEIPQKCPIEKIRFLKSPYVAEKSFGALSQENLENFFAGMASVS